MNDKSKKKPANKKEIINFVHSPAEWCAECFSLPPQVFAVAASYGGPAPLVSRLAGRSLKTENTMTTASGIDALLNLINREAYV